MYLKIYKQSMQSKQVICLHKGIDVVPVLDINLVTP